ncbi:hypothetical protein DA2_0669 [Desulfovibrio sp. A2]|nr:hypothetical protein DA2_0669 [Desulfovibrio sp. A2]
MIELIPTCTGCVNAGAWICQGCSAIGCVFFAPNTSGFASKQAEK